MPIMVDFTGRSAETRRAVREFRNGSRDYVPTVLEELTCQIASSLADGVRSLFKYNSKKNDNKKYANKIGRISTYNEKNIDMPVSDKFLDSILHEPAPQLTDSAPALIENKYKLTAKLGEGAIGTAYLAEHPVLGNKSCVKILKMQCRSEGELASKVEELVNRYKPINELNHSGIQKLQHITAYNDSPALVFDYCEGKSLEEIAKQGPLNERTAVHITMKVLDILQAAHTQGIYHGDVRPANVIVNKAASGNGYDVKLIDFATYEHANTAVNAAPGYSSFQLSMPKEPSKEDDIRKVGQMLYDMTYSKITQYGRVRKIVDKSTSYACHYTSADTMSREIVCLYAAPSGSQRPQEGLYHVGKTMLTELAKPIKHFFRAPTRLRQDDYVDRLRWSFVDICERIQLMGMYGWSCRP